MAPDLTESTRRIVGPGRHAVLEPLRALLRIPSVSADPARAADVARCADWLAAHLRRIGCVGVEVVRTARHPVVLADAPGPPGAPVLLVYGHYDVQPPDPIGSWATPPFRPSVRGSDLVARGASDDKGQLFAHVAAVERWIRARGRPPITVRFLLDGEEEIGSPNLRTVLHARQSRLAADVAVVSDMRIPSPDRPALTYALRGALGLEVRVLTGSSDLHSGTFGGAAPDAALILARLLTRLIDENGCVRAPGFADQVRRWSPSELAFMRRQGPADREILTSGGIARAADGPRRSLYERTTILPSISVSGLTAGYQGSGPKSIVPNRASAKLNVRLVPDQDPTRAARSITTFLRRATPSGVETSIEVQLKAPWALVRKDHPAMRAAAVAYLRGFGRRPKWLRSGGTIPVVGWLQEILDVPVVLMGFALPSDRMHAPNEKLHLPTFFRGIETASAFYEELGRSAASGTSRLSRVRS